jgi:hypothetical protein
MKIIHLINDTYQVVNQDENIIYFQGSKDECKKLIKKQKKYQQWYNEIKQKEQ